MASGTPRTLPQILRDAARKTPGKPALRSKRRGVWQATDLRGYFEAAVETALALRADGVVPGDTVLVFAFNGPEWLMADMGIQIAGGRSAGLYPDMAPDERLEILAALAPSVVFCCGHEQVDQVLAAEASGCLPGLRRIVFWEPAGLQSCTDPRLVAYDAFRAAAAEQGNRTGMVEAIDALDPEAVAALCLTRGVTGRVRTVPLTHADLVAAGKRAVAGVEAGPNGCCLAYLPLANAMARQCSATLSLMTGEELVFAEAEQGLFSAMQTIQPQSVALFPNGWAELVSQLTVRLEQSPKLPSRLRLRALRDPQAGRARRVFGAGMRRFMGLARNSSAICLGGLPDQETRSILERLGIRLHYGYGLTETGGLTHMSQQPQSLLDAPLPGVTVTTDEGGQIHITTGPRGGIATGDQRCAAAVRLGQIDRQSDRHGGYGHPVGLGGLESLLTDSRWIRRAAACPGPDGVTLMIEIDPVTTARWAAERKLAFTDFASLVARPELRELIDADIAQRLSGLDGTVRIAGHHLLDGPLDLERGELAPVYGLRRARVAERLVLAQEG
ncbi:AMP-binding protein [Marinibacterium sp. SX1]|uniref:AMP-binding protein n=1 Tax=Marinibacterium sp. SX1 TaxID=3388424 RepID=UPI003D17BFB0